jgi:hypothetical protein
MAETRRSNSPAGEYAMLHFPVRDAASAVMYVAGFAFPVGSTYSPVSELEWLQPLSWTPSTRSAGAPRASSTMPWPRASAAPDFNSNLCGLKSGRETARPSNAAAEIQQSLENVLKRIREFNEPE